jgi:recombination protein U
MNNGKIFEQEIKASVPENVFFYRFKDGTASWGKSDGVRFQAHNICDCMIYDGISLYLLELKSHKGKSIPLSCIRETQITDLNENAMFQNIVCGFLFNFSDLGRTFFVDVGDVLNFKRHSDRKSIPIEYCIEQGIEIEGTKKRTRYTWNIKDLLE